MNYLKLTLAATLLLAGTAQSAHYHSWYKVNETYGRDQFGVQVIICSWKCTADYANPHFTQTQGVGFCPHP
mgnify:FL=1